METIGKVVKKSDIGQGDEAPESLHVLRGKEKDECNRKKGIS